MYNIKEAWSMYRDNGEFNMCRDDGEVFLEYSPAYVTTNEDVRMLVDKFKPAGKRVLLNAGSGDAPMFFSAYGAKDVDSFDISFCAKAIMDIKTAAIQKMDLPEYCKFVHKLFFAKDFGFCSDIVDSSPILTRHFITDMQGYAIFSNGTCVIDEALPHREEYKKMKKILKSPIPFIQSDLKDLSGHLNKQYDLMCFSNIFQYEMNKDNIVKVLNNMCPFLSKNGIIIVHVTWFFREFELKKYSYVADKVASWACMKKIQEPGQELIILQKVR